MKILKSSLSNKYDLAVIDFALDESKKGYVPIEDRNVTLFWDKMIDYVNENFLTRFRFIVKKVIFTVLVHGG